MSATQGSGGLRLSEAGGWVGGKWERINGMGMCEEMNPREKNQKIPRAEKEEKGRSQKREPDLSLTRLEFRSIVHIAERSLMGRSLSITRTIILES